MEIELKLALHPCHIARIQQYSLLKEIIPEQRSLLITYFDTPKFDLMQRRIALRIRQADGQCIQTLKAETKSVGALTSRPEWETQINSSSHPDFSVLPRIALDLLAGIKLKHIAPIFTTDFLRTTWQVNNQKEHAEVALDIGNIYARAIYRNICEVEIELKLGAPVFLFDIAAQLLQQVALYIEPHSKAERGYLLSGAMYNAPAKAIHLTIHKDQHSIESWNTIMQDALAQMVANVAGFLESTYDIEYLRQLCSASQYLHIGLLLTKSLNQTLPGWNQPLRQLMKELNSVLDWHVLVYET